MHDFESRPTVTHLPASVRTFASIEQLDELPRELGWPLEYRQIDPGPFSSTFADVEGDGWFLMEEQSSRRVEVEAAAPEGMFVLAVFEGDPGVVNGKPISPGHIFLQTPGSDFLCTLPAGMTATQVGIAEEDFEETIRALAPNASVPRRDVTVFAASPDGIANVRRDMRAAILTPSSRKTIQDEAVADIAAGIIATAFDQDEVALGRDMHRANARRVLNRAREYIEAHLHEAIRIASMCRYSGASYSSLERVFARELGVSPQQYVIARRLNAVRRFLLGADGDLSPRISDVALDHGFAHLGRFAADYRRYFGELPRDTRRSR